MSTVVSLPQFPVRGTVIIPCPLGELWNGISVDLLIRVVKIVVKGVWRWHFYEIDNVIVRVGEGFAHQLNGRIESDAFKGDYYQSILKNAVGFAPKEVRDIEFSAVKTLPSLSLDNVLNFLNVKESIWKSPQFRRVSFVSK
ncbi:MAG: hypothetical protein ABSA17_04140 [Rhabdochlamydiaceae bacterium]|jgi:hypothetical protein